MENKSALPQGWATTTLAQLLLEPKSNIVDGPFGSNLKASEYQERGVPILRIQNIKSLRFIPKNIKYILPAKAKQLARHSYRPGDIIITKLGDPLGEACILPPSIEEGIIVADLVRLRLDNTYIDKKWLCYAINADGIASQLKAITKGTTRPRVNLIHIRELQISVPPLNEQKRMVAKIEELFSELDKGIENLKTAREQLKVYRQAILKHAFEGKLTAHWREQNKEKIESAEQLLGRVKHNAKNNAVFNSRETSDLPEIPSQWLYTRLSNVGELARGKSKHRPRNDKKLFGGKYPFIQTGEVKAANRLIKEYTQTYSDFGLAQSKLWPAGTLCITIAANIAETAFLGIDACFPDSVVGFTAQENVILPEYVDFFIQSVRTRIEAYAPATAQKNINLTTLENLIIPLCSTDEQREMVRQIDAIFSSIDSYNAEIENSLQKAEALRQSILKKAFSGRLVAQDPNDEPASVLLERIRTEKEAQETESTKPKAKRNAA